MPRGVPCAVRGEYSAARRGATCFRGCIPRPRARRRRVRGRSGGFHRPPARPEAHRAQIGAILARICASKTDTGGIAGRGGGSRGMQRALPACSLTRRPGRPSAQLVPGVGRACARRGVSRWRAQAGQGGGGRGMRGGGGRSARRPLRPRGDSRPIFAPRTTPPVHPAGRPGRPSLRADGARAFDTGTQHTNPAEVQLNSTPLRRPPDSRGRGRRLQRLTSQRERLSDIRTRCAAG